MRYEYRVLPAPVRVRRSREAKSVEAAAAAALAELLNTQAEAGWDYIGRETAPLETRSRLGGRRESQAELLVFRRALSAASARVTDEPEAEAAPRLGPARLD